MADWHLSPIPDTGGFVFLSGVTGTHPGGSVAADPETQIRDAFDFLEAHLAAAGLSFEHVVEMTTYHVGLRQRLATFIKVKDAYVSTPYPAWSAIGVSEFITAGTIIEIRVIARRR